MIVILSDGEAGVEGSVNIPKRENGFFDFAAYGRFAQNDTSGKVLGNLPGKGRLLRRKEDIGKLETQIVIKGRIPGRL